MDIEFSKIIIPAIAGLISGGIGSLIAPWVSWKIEKKKLLQQNRKELIKNARQALMQENLSNKDFRNLAIYSQIKPYLSTEAVKSVEGEMRKDGIHSTEIIKISIGGGRHAGINPFKNRVLDELSQLEREWGLL